MKEMKIENLVVTKDEVDAMKTIAIFAQRYANDRPGRNFPDDMYLSFRIGSEGQGCEITLGDCRRILELYERILSKKGKK